MDALEVPWLVYTKIALQKDPLRSPRAGTVGNRDICKVMRTVPSRKPHVWFHAILLLLILFKQRTPHFLVALSPTNYVVCSV